MELKMVVLAVIFIAACSNVEGRVARPTTTAGHNEKLMREEHEIPRNTLYINDPSELLGSTPSPDQEWIAEAVAASNVDPFTEPEEIAGADCDLAGEESKITQSEFQAGSPSPARGRSIQCPDTYAMVYHTSVGCTLPGGTEEVSTDPPGATEYQPEPYSSNVHEIFSTLNQTTNTANPVSKRGVEVLVGEGSGLTNLDLDSENIKVLNYTNLKVYSVDCHRSSGAVFLSAADIIASTQENVPVVVSAGVAGSVRLAVDWLHDKLYWMADNNQTVEVANVNGTDRSVLVNAGLNFTYPNNIALDPHQSFLFLVSNSSIYRTDLRGGNLTVLYSARRVRSLAVDEVNKRVYFSGRYPSGKPYVSFTDYEGKAVEDIILQDITTGDIFSLDVFHNTLYFAQFSNNRDSMWTLDLSSSSAPVKKYEPSANRGGIWSIRVCETVRGNKTDG